MMLAVLNPNESLTAVMIAAAATTAPTYAAFWNQAGGNTNNPVGSLDGTTAVTLVAAPAQGTREVSRVSIYNTDTAAVTVTISKVDDGTSFTIAKASIPVGGHLLADAHGVLVVDSSGQRLEAKAGDGGTVGTAATSVTASETGDLVRKTVLTMTDLSVTVGNSTGVSFGGTKIYDFPAGRILVLGVTVADISVDLTDAGNVTPIAAADGGDIALGTTAPDDGTMAGTDVDLLPSTSIDPISDGVDGAALAASAQFDGTTTAKDMFFNMLIDDADVGDGASDVLLISGTVTVHWLFLGDF